MRFVAVGSVLVLAVALAACGTTMSAVSSGTAPGAASSAPAAEEEPVEASEAEAVEEPAEEPAEAMSTCDAVREAILTGTQAEIDAAMLALQKDKSADPTAREYARYYLERDANSPDLREMDISLIQMSCM